MMRKQRKRKLLACVLAAAMAFGSTFASAATTTVSRYTGSTYTHNAQFDNCIIVDGVDVSAYQETIDWQAAWILPSFVWPIAATARQET